MAAPVGHSFEQMVLRQGPPPHHGSKGDAARVIPIRLVFSLCHAICLFCAFGLTIVARPEHHNGLQRRSSPRWAFGEVA